MKDKEFVKELIHSEDFLEHWGVLGMKWGVRKDRGTGGGGPASTRSTRKAAKKAVKIERAIIKQRKNDMLNEVVEASQKIKAAVDRNLKTPESKVWEVMEDAFERGVDPGPKENKVVMDHITEKAQKYNDYIKANPKVLPKGMTITYNAKEFSGDDLVLNPRYTYNGKPITFSWASNSKESDRVFLEEPKDINHSGITEDFLEHYGVLGMKWGVRKDKASRVRKTSRRPSKKELYKKAKTLSDEELRKTVNRIQLEKQYVELSEKEIDRGKKASSKVLKVVGGVALAGLGIAGAATGREALKTIGKSIGGTLGDAATPVVVKQVEKGLKQVEKKFAK